MELGKEGEPGGRARAEPSSGLGPDSPRPSFLPPFSLPHPPYTHTL